MHAIVNLHNVLVIQGVAWKKTTRSSKETLTVSLQRFIFIFIFNVFLPFTCTILLVGVLNKTGWTLFTAAS